MDSRTERYNFGEANEVSSVVSVEPPIKLPHTDFTTEVNGIHVATQLTPAGYSYKLYNTTFFKQVNPTLADLPTKSNSSLMSQQVGSERVTLFPETSSVIDIAFSDFIKYKEFWSMRAGIINPWVLKAGLYPQSFVLQNYPRSVHEQTIENVEPFSERSGIYKIKYEPYVYVVENETEMIRRFSAKTGLEDKLLSLSLIVEGSSSFQNKITDLARFLNTWTHRLPAVDTVPFVEQEIRTANASGKITYVEDLKKWLQDVTGEVRKILPNISPDASPTLSLQQLSPDMLQQVEGSRVRLLSIQLSKNLIDVLPDATFIHPKFNQGNAHIASAVIQQYYDNLGRIVDFNNAREFQAIFKIALDELISRTDGNIPDKNSEFGSRFDSFGKIILEKCLELLF